MRGRPPAVQQPRRGEDERAGADGRDARPVRIGGAQRGEGRAGHGQGRVLDPRHDHRVRAGDVAERPGRADAEPAGAHLRCLAADAHVDRLLAFLRLPKDQ